MTERVENRFVVLSLCRQVEGCGSMVVDRIGDSLLMKADGMDFFIEIDSKLGEIKTFDKLLDCIVADLNKKAISEW